MNVCSGDSLIIFEIVGKFLTVIKIVVPIILIVMGSIDFMKAAMAGKEDEIKQYQSIFMKRVIAAAIVFLVPTIVGLLLSVIKQDKTSCLTCVLNTSTCSTSQSGDSANNNGGTPITDTDMGYCSKFTTKENCDESMCAWVNMSRFGNQFQNPATNDYFCTYK